ncbi:DUF4331 domain-containing protein [candidate division KSB1 bacterium]|nr:MAG: DUF4331 domain-containing protein [candidate division KSB1 bacterium]MBC6950303.1 DUF4331 domain-containing protein [candidate division KSB1 bacterium]MCE7940988.1 DUF4331 domain-containing protein [Chlorobi bacterium CHB1]MDL1875001.1 DUF4331 domain-containing protein [Cytophagia bacterium CHB2]
MRKFFIALFTLAGALALLLHYYAPSIEASSHREAPLIAQDPLADNTDLWVFRSPDDPNTVTIVAGYIGLELPEGGPNWTTFAEGVRYEIHIKNKTSVGALGTAQDDITYRFTFTQTNEDPTTFFNIRLGKQNLKTTYTMEKSVNGGAFTTVITNGIVPPNNIGPRSINDATVGLGQTYDALVAAAINTTSPDGEKVLCGPRDDVFFVDLGGVFDLGQTRSSYGTSVSDPLNARDAVAGYNVHCIIMNIPINKLQKDGKSVSEAANILDGDFVIGVWASASRQKVTTLQPTGPGSKPLGSGEWVQVSRLGMPLTNEAVIPLGQKDYWNAVTPYSVDEQNFAQYFYNPELALYMDDSQFGGAVPALSALRVQAQSYPALGVIPGYSTPGFDFRNGKDGAFAAASIPGIDFTGTALAVPTGPKNAAVPLQTALVAPGEPRRADIFPVFYFGVPNLIPYHLATGKTGGPLSAGKPFINNFLPITNDNGVYYGGDMLRLNMAVPITDRNSTEYNVNARFGLLRAAALGLTAAPYNTNANLEPIPHMDGFPNGRRLEDDVTSIELQAVGGLVLAAVGFPFDDAVQGNYSDLASAKLLGELLYNAGPTKNDLAISTAFPYLPNPHRGYDYVKKLVSDTPNLVQGRGIGIGVPNGFILEQNYPNPFNPATQIQYHVAKTNNVRVKIFNSLGQEVATLVDKAHQPGTYTVSWDAKGFASGTYYYRLEVGNEVVSAKRAVLVK